MGYIDLRRRRYERKSGGLSQYPGSHPHFLLAVGFVSGVISSALFCITFGDPNPVGALLLLAAVITLLGYLGWLMLERSPASTRPRSGAEKQLLTAIADAGAGISPVEAALKTSLTMDKAEEILTRLADRGHLRVQSRDGGLFYALPGGRRPSETWVR